MVKTVLITGASSGIGAAAVRLFQSQGWNVAATMRSPDKAPELAQLERVICPRLDVNDPASIPAAIAQTLDQFGSIDVLVNNAGYALLGPFEATDPEQIRQQFNTNVFGLMEVTRAILPHFRDRKAGILINIASIGGQMTFPLYSSYHGTKWAVEGFSESLQYELEEFNIRVKIIEPGPIKTDFYGRSEDVAQKEGLTAYDDLVKKVVPNLKRAGATGSPPEVTARVIYKAATDGSSKLRYPAGGNAGLLLFARRFSLERGWRRGIRWVTMR
ncbi:MAG: SDR family oxidoreductase [Synechococcales cyanobacterium CRU_2_2]|nr:SDR family oxidoreductase [Synechococcales cyanobacterium CRU_2_2]